MQHCNRCNRTYFEPGDKVLLSASGHGKFENQKVDNCNRELDYAACIVLTVDGKQVSIRSENGQERTVPHAWLINYDPRIDRYRRERHS